MIVWWIIAIAFFLILIIGPFLDKEQRLRDSLPGPGPELGIKKELFYIGIVILITFIVIKIIVFLAGLFCSLGNIEVSLF